MAGNGLDAGCPSEASGFPATFETNDHNGLKSEHDQLSNNNPQMLEFVKLSNGDSVCCGPSSKVELDFFHHDKVATARANNNNNEGIDENAEEEQEEKTSSEVTKTFSCSFCKREFSSSQALGGHQNAHKQERAIAKRRQEIDAGAFGYPYFPSLYGSSYNRALGVRVESMIHKPPYHPWTPLRYGHGPAGWSRHHGILQNPPPTLDRLSSTMEGLQQHGSGLGILGSATSSALKVDDENLHSAIGPIPQFGGSSSSANVAGGSNSGINKEPEEPSSSSILDLSLKL